MLLNLRPSSSDFSSCFLGTLNSFGLFSLRYALVLVTTILLFPTRTVLAQQAPDQTRNFTIPLDSPPLIYTPFRCDRDTAPEQCNGGWLTGRTGGDTTISTTGPNMTAAGVEVIPQMFFQFRGSALYLLTSEASNAQANITITTNGTTIAAVFDSTLGSASILNLVASSVTTFALTFLPANDTRRFELTGLILTVPHGTLTTTLPILPSMTLPPFSSPPIFTPIPTNGTSGTPGTLPPLTSPVTTIPNPPFPSPAPASSNSDDAHRSNVAIAVGVTVGLGLGLTSVVAFSYWWLRRRKSSRLRWVQGSSTTAQNGLNVDVIDIGVSESDDRNASRVDWPRATENFGGITPGGPDPGVRTGVSGVLLGPGGGGATNDERLSAVSWRSR